MTKEAKTINDQEWERRTSRWVNAQHASSKRKEEANKLGLSGKERREYLAGEERPHIEQ